MPTFEVGPHLDLDSTTNDFIAGVWKYISPDDPRSKTSEMAAGVRAFCGDLDEFWAWVPPLERFATWFGLGPEAADLYARYWDWDLQMLQSLVVPWPDGWPDHLHDLHAAADDAGVEIPPRQANHLAPDVHAAWNRDLFSRIRQTWDG